MGMTGSSDQVIVTALTATRLVQSSPPSIGPDIYSGTGSFLRFLAYLEQYLSSWDRGGMNGKSVQVVVTKDGVEILNTTITTATSPYLSLAYVAISTPTPGTYVCTMTYAGDAAHAGCEYISPSYTVDAATVLDAVADKAEYLAGETIVLTARLTRSDTGAGVVGAPIVMTGSATGTTNTDADGYAVFTRTIPNSGTFTYNFSFAGGTYATNDNPTPQKMMSSAAVMSTITGDEPQVEPAAVVVGVALGASALAALAYVVYSAKKGGK